MKIMKKRLLILFFAIAAALCMAVGLVACGGSSSDNEDVVADVPSQSTESEAGTSSSTTKQAPVYQGMVISSVNTMSTLSSDGAVKSYAAMGGAAAEPTPSGDASSALTGDVNIDGVDPATQIEVEGEDTLIEDEIEATFGVTGTGQSIYYADPGEDIFVTVKLSNPDKFEIMSFVLNGEKYTSYMFESGSDLENLIVKLNVGTKAGFSEYTIDEIKYVDGTEIKDVLLDGDTTVKCGVRTDNLPYATVTNETVTLDEISMDVKVTDLYSLISESDGYCMAVLFDGSDDTIYTEYLEAGTNAVTFSSLKANTVYQYAVFAVYDDLSGAGVTLNYLYTENFRTKNIVLFDNVEVTKTGVSFSYLWYDGYENATINHLSLESEGEIKLQSFDSDTTEIDGLLSNHNYTLTASYIGLDGSVESIHMSFTTYAMETPKITIDSLTSTKTDIPYSVSVIDEDGVGAITSVTLYRNGETVSSSEALAGVFENLFSNNAYTLTVVYTYDLNDGYGDQTLEVSGTVSTLAKVSPVISFDSVTSTKTEISYTVSVTDEDGLGSLTSVTVYHGNEVLASGTALSGEFTNLLSNNKYTVVVEYTYDANDGKGEQTLVVSKDIMTETVATPVVSIEFITSTQTEINYSIAIADEDDVGSITSVFAAIGDNVTYASEDGVITGLLSDNTYTMTVEYTYDLNDGNGNHAITLSQSIKTLAKAAPIAEIVLVEDCSTELTYCVLFTDGDNVGNILNICLYCGEVLADEDTTPYTGEKTYTNLSSYTLYTLVVSYEYDLNDGTGKTETSVELTCYTAPVIEFISVEILNTEILYEGDTVLLEISMNNPNDASITSAIINGESYDVSQIGTSSRLFINIADEGQLSYGNITLTVTQLTGYLDGQEYHIDVTDNNTVSLFINGTLSVENFSVVKFTNGSEETATYAFQSEQLYFKVELQNKTGYDISSIVVGEETYNQEDFYISEDRQTIYLAVTDGGAGWVSVRITSVEYGNELIGKSKTNVSGFGVQYVRLATDEVVEIYTAEQLLDVGEWKYYVLMNDIDLSGYQWYNMGNNLCGVFDGNGYAISNVSAVITYTETTLYLGLFESADGIIQNLNVIDVLYVVSLNTSARVYFGGMVAYAYDIGLYNCSVSSSVQITESVIDIGAVIGYIQWGGFCYNTVAVLVAEIGHSYSSNGVIGVGDFDGHDSECSAKINSREWNLSGEFHYTAE